MIGASSTYGSERWMDVLLRRLVGVVVFLFPSVCLLINHSDSLCMIALAFVGFWVGFRQGFTANITRDDTWFAAVCAGFFLSAVLSFTFVDYTEVGFHLLGRYLRLLLALPVLLALRRYRPAPFLVWSSLGLGALLLGVEAVSEIVHVGGEHRSEGDTNVAILFGDLALLTAFIFAAGYLYIVERLPRGGPFLMAVGVASGLLAVFLSGTRGAWLAMPLLLIVFLACRHDLRLRVIIVGIALTMSLFILLYIIPPTGIRGRVDGTFEQLHAYWLSTQETRSFNGTPTCLDQRGVLQSWLDVGDYSQAPELDVRIVAEQGSVTKSLRDAGCSHGDVIRLHNVNTLTDAVVDFPHYIDTNRGISNAHLISRGQGTAWFVGHTVSAQSVRTDSYAPLTVQSPANYGGWVRIDVPPGATLWLVPVEVHAGEYSPSLAQSPIGQRLEMWRAALMLFRESPILGTGTGAYRDHALQLTNAGRVAPVVAEYDHPHSDYFDALSSRGLLGMLALLGLLGIPALLFLQSMRGAATRTQAAAVAGLLVTAGFAIFGLTETMFIHSVTITWYVIMTAVFLVMVDAPDEGRLVAET